MTDLAKLEREKKYREGYNMAIQNAIAALVMVRDKPGLTWRDRVNVIYQVQQLIPPLIKGCVYFMNTQPGQENISGLVGPKP